MCVWDVGCGTLADWFSFLYRSAAFFFSTPASAACSVSKLPLDYLSTSMAFLFSFFFSSSVFLHKRRWRSQQPNLSYPIRLSYPTSSSKRHLTTGCICICACVITTPCSVLLVLHFFFFFFLNHYHWHCIACIASLASGLRELIRFPKFYFFFAFGVTGVGLFMYLFCLLYLSIQLAGDKYLILLT